MHIYFTILNLYGNSAPNAKPQTPNSKLQTPNAKRQTPNPKRLINRRYFHMFQLFTKNNSRKKRNSKIGFSKLDYVGIGIMLILFVVSIFFVMYSLIFD
jgi:hypothetical protein